MPLFFSIYQGSDQLFTHYHNCEQGENTPTSLSRITVVIPTLNAGNTLCRTLSSLPCGLGNIIICDGGSRDDTVSIAKSHGIDIVQTPRGRGRQLHAGANAASGEWLLFLHADTLLTYQAVGAMTCFINDCINQERLGYFRFKLDDNGMQAKKLERRVRWRCHTFALPYGDQGFLISRRFYDHVGGFQTLPLMEDVDFIWRIEKKSGKSALVELAADAITSSEKFQRHGYFKRSARNLFCLFLFWIKVPPSMIVKIY